MLDEYIENVAKDQTKIREYKDTYPSHSLLQIWN